MVICVTGMVQKNSFAINGMVNLLILTYMKTNRANLLLIICVASLVGLASMALAHIVVATDQWPKLWPYVVFPFKDILFSIPSMMIFLL